MSRENAQAALAHVAYEIYLMRAVVAQSVERRLGKAEVGGSIPLGSLYI